MPGLRTKRRLAWLNGGHVCGLVQEDDDSVTRKLRQVSYVKVGIWTSCWKLLKNFKWNRTCSELQLSLLERTALDGLRRSGLEARKKLNGKKVEDVSFALATTTPLFYNPGQATWIKWADGSSPSPRGGQVVSFWACRYTPSPPVRTGLNIQDMLIK